jgi:predicted dehydrogenase
MNAIPAPAVARPRIGFAGVGWIGLSRLKAVAAADTAQIVCITDTNREIARQAVDTVVERAPGVGVARSFEELLNAQLDGVVIATPSGLHAEQAIAALESGLAVFCQKPLARTGREAGRVIDVARKKDRLLAVDFCYRTVAGVGAMMQLARTGALGEIFAVELVFHNAYGPDKPWFYDLRQSGGGCVMDLGIHLIDLLLLVLDYPRVAEVRSRLHAQGRLLGKPTIELEDHALAEVQFETGTTARLACSWRLAAGREAIIEAAFYGTRGAVVLRNVGGSFYDFVVEHCEGTTRRTLAEGPDDWGGRAINAWARQLAATSAFNPSAARLHDVAAFIDALYGWI